MENETLNQEKVNETLENDDFFSDSDWSEFEEEPEEVEEVKEEPKAEEKAEETAPNDDFLEITYNKENKKLTREEAKNYAQKGMNYDKMVERYAPIDELARANGMDTMSFIKSLQDTQFQFEVSNEIEHLKTQYPDANEELIKQLATSNVNAKMGQQRNQFEMQQKEQSDALHEQVRKDIETLKAEFPDVDLNNLPEEVFDLVKQGFNLVSAYYKYQHKQDLLKLSANESKAKITAQNESNKKKSLGNISNAGDGEQEDAFFVGLNSI